MSQQNRTFTDQLLRRPSAEDRMAAKERKIPDFTPDELEQIESIKQKVLNKPVDAPKPVTRPLLPNFYKDGGKVSDSEDVGTANARADEKAIAQGEKDFGRNNSSIRNRAHMPNPEPKVSPLIQIYPAPRRSYAKGGPVRAKNAPYYKG